MDGFEVMPRHRGGARGRHLHHRHRRHARARRAALRRDEGRRDRRQLRPLQRRDRHPGAGGDVDRASREARPFVEEFELGDGRRIFLLGEGRLINLAAAEGHPAAVMDMSFANQALAAEHIGQARARSSRSKVYVVPEEIDQEIAALKLETMGIAIDTLTAEQAEVPDELGPGNLSPRRSRLADEGDAARGGARHPPAAAHLRAAEADGADPRPAGDGAHPAAAGAARVRRRDREPALLPRPDPRAASATAPTTACGSPTRSSRSCWAPPAACATCATTSATRRS